MWTIEKWVEMGKIQSAPAVDCGDDKEMVREFLKHLEDKTIVRWRSGAMPTDFAGSNIRGLFCGYKEDTYPYSLSYCSSETTLLGHGNVISIYDFVEFAKPDYSGFEDILLGE